MSNDNIQSVSATGEEINQLVTMIEDVLVGQPKGKVLIALLSLILVVQNPEITPEELQEGVRNVSQYICLYMDSIEAGPVPKEMLN